MSETNRETEADTCSKPTENAIKARALDKKNTQGEFLPQQGPTGRRHRATGEVHRESLRSSVRVRMTKGMKDDVDTIVQYVGLWKDQSEFARDAIRRLRDRWIFEARRARKDLEEEK